MVLEVLKQPIVQTGTEPSEEEVEGVVTTAVDDAITTSKGRVGILLSGGVDSTLLLRLALRHGRIPVFTVVTDLSHPDLEAAEKVARKYRLEHHVLMPSKEDLDRAKRKVVTRGKGYPGDAAVYLALELAKSKGVDTLLVTDGIDELTGGYWWHANSSNRFSGRREAFEYFWDRLGPEHIEPLQASADKIGIELKYPFLDSRVVSTLTRIPIDKRVEGGVTKSWWKKFSRRYVPEYVVGRPKLGMVSSLDESITSTLPSSIDWEVDYENSEPVRRSSRRGKKYTSNPTCNRITCREVRLL